VTALEDTFRAEWGRVVASLAAFLGDIQLAEDAAQEAFAIAAERWPVDGAPGNPTGWLITTARNRAIDRLRRERSLAEKTEQLGRELPSVTEESVDDATIFPDERLELIFACCHPALAREAQVALTLRTLGGLTSEEIARAFLIPFETMSKRLTRAKHKIRDARIPIAAPPAELLPERLDAVLAVVYLIFNEGWGDGRGDLAAEAIRLGRALVELMPDEPEAAALLALMLLNDSRRAARFRDGSLVRLDDQDRSLWDEREIAEGRALLARALQLRGSGPYVLQAAIADLHLDDPRDWREIAELYGVLAGVTRSPVVELNRAIAVAEVEGPEAALAGLDGLPLDEYRYFHSTRADLLRRLGRSDDARAAYARALELAPSDAERRFLEARIAELAPRPAATATTSGPRRSISSRPTDGGPKTTRGGSVGRALEIVTEWQRRQASGDVDHLADVVDLDGYTENCLGLTGWTTGYATAAGNYYRNMVAPWGDMQQTVEEVVEDGGAVVIRQHLTAIHVGEFHSVPATGRRISWDALAIIRVRDGRIVGAWIQPDLWGIHQQLSAAG
jgi:RNA polymerase sigma-70 factor, ECF subfamily